MERQKMIEEAREYLQYRYSEACGETATAVEKNLYIGAIAMAERLLGVKFEVVDNEVRVCEQ